MGELGRVENGYKWRRCVFIRTFCIMAHRGGWPTPSPEA